MRLYFTLSFFLVVLWTHAHGQSLALDDLITIQKMGAVEKVNDYLSAKSWQFDGSDPSDGFTQVVWAFKSNGNSIGSSATLNVVFCDSCAEGVSVVFYRTHDKKIIDIIKQKALNYKMAATTTVGTEAISTTYRGATYQIRITTEKAEPGRRPIYSVDLSKIEVFDASPR